MIKGFNHFLIIIDEIKFLFGLNKCGTYKVYIEGKPVTMLRYPVSPDYGKELFYFPDKLINNYYIKKEVRKILVFRSIFAIKNTNEKSILFDEVNDLLYSYKELNTCFRNDKEYNINLNSRIFNKWFDNNNNIEYVIKMDLLEENGYKPDLLKLREDIDFIINNIDSNYLWLTSNMIQYISTMI